jgi:hypothetical protein
VQANADAGLRVCVRNAWWFVFGRLCVLVLARGAMTSVIWMLCPGHRGDRKGFICRKKPIDTMIAWG